jgi:hypothetical protein
MASASALVFCARIVFGIAATADPVSAVDLHRPLTL